MAHHDQGFLVLRASNLIFVPQAQDPEMRVFMSTSKTELKGIKGDGMHSSRMEGPIRLKLCSKNSCNINARSTPFKMSCHRHIFMSMVTADYYYPDGG